MALFIAHPDYMKFNKDKLNKDEYPIEYYKEFLTYIKTKYEGPLLACIAKRYGALLVGKL